MVIEFEVGDKKYYMYSDEYDKLQKFYNKLKYGKESLS